MATSPPRWRLTAPSPSVQAPPERGVLLRIEASIEPHVYATRGMEPRTLAPVDERPWAGRGDYYAPPGWQIAAIDLESTCTNAGVCTDCDPPPGAHLRVVGADIVGPWTLSADSEPLTATVPADRATPTFEVEVEASSRPTVEAIASTPRPNIVPRVSAHGATPPTPAGAGLYRFWVTWSQAGDEGAVKTPVEHSFVVRATLESFCRPGEAAAAECKPPAGASVRVAGVKVY
ncbi:MAG TPA: hypothetical protein VFS43_16945 [Polyangiaceae bacterium]|nr:hypothetical protein [Polyangiaceae bacterium]